MKLRRPQMPGRHHRVQHDGDVSPLDKLLHVECASQVGAPSGRL